MPSTCPTGWRFDDLAEYVLDANAARRNQSTGARAMSTALVLVQAFQVREETDAAER